MVTVREGLLRSPDVSVKTGTRAQHGATLRKEVQAEGPTSSGSRQEPAAGSAGLGGLGERKERTERKTGLL